jgi:hypothetical protein
VLRPFTETLLDFRLPVEDCLAELARVWLSAMRPQDRPREEESC